MKINGQEAPLNQQQTLAALLLAREYDLRTIAVVLNGEIVPKARYDSTRLADEDVLEVVHFVGGG